MLCSLVPFVCKFHQSVGTCQVFSSVGTCDVSSSVGTCDVSSSVGMYQVSSSEGTCDVFSSVGTCDVFSSVGTCDVFSSVGTCDVFFQCGNVWCLFQCGNVSSFSSVVTPKRADEHWDKRTTKENCCYCCCCCCCCCCWVGCWTSQQKAGAPHVRICSDNCRCCHSERNVCGSKLITHPKSLIRNKQKAIFHYKTGGYNPNQVALHQLARHQQTIIFNLGTGHCRLNSHLKRTGVKTSAQCPRGEADQTPEHYLQSCSLHQQARQQIWPTCVSLKTKLWGSAEDLFLTSEYAALTGERESSQRNHIKHSRRSRYLTQP